MDIEISEQVDKIIQKALMLGASDLHFDPFSDGIGIHLRIHGKLLPLDQVSDFPFYTEQSAMARLKVLAKLSLAERRRPQDGQYHFLHGDAECDLRMATMPTIRGERAVVRILPKENPWQSMASLGFTKALEEEVHQFFSGAGGMLITAGKVGSGKSTTLYALMRERNLLGESVLTIEDPVERKLDSFSQVEVDEKIGLTFAEGLRNALRQDPDLLMVGEIRDELTAQIAVRAGLTGHHLLSTVHADSPYQVITRLLEFGVERSYLSESLKLIIWQRLLPIQCDECHGEGCAKCHQVGVMARRAEFNMLGASHIQQFLRDQTRTSEYNVKGLKMFVAEKEEAAIETN